MTKSFDSTSLCWSARCVLLLTGFMFFIQSPFSLTAQEGLGKVKRDAVNRLELTSDYQKARAIKQYPIGVFDSGTGGLTVLEQILELDQFDNRRTRCLSSNTKHDGGTATVCVPPPIVLTRTSILSPVSSPC